MSIPEIEPSTLAKQLAGPPETQPLLLDVRFPHEHAIVALPNSQLVPLPSLEDHLDQLQGFRNRQVVVYCHHGTRSLDGAAFLRAHGLDAVSLSGGIDRYAREVDPSLPRY